MRPLRRAAPADRRAARLLRLVAPSDTEPTRPELSGVDALARVLAAYGPERLSGRGETRESDRALRAAARRLAAEARTRDAVAAERLLIELRRAWRELPQMRGLGDSARRAAIWDRVVGLCCEEFYAPAAAGANAGAPRAPRPQRPT